MPIRPPPASKSPIVRTLAAEAKRQELTPYALAQASGVSIPTITRTLGGKVSPTLATVEAVAEALGFRLSLEKRASSDALPAKPATARKSG